VGAVGKNCSHDGPFCLAHHPPKACGPTFSQRARSCWMFWSTTDSGLVGTCGDMAGHMARRHSLAQCVAKDVCVERSSGPDQARPPASAYAPCPVLTPFGLCFGLAMERSSDQG
jgi:hypothetical protein